MNILSRSELKSIKGGLEMPAGNEVGEVGGGGCCARYEVGGVVHGEDCGLSREDAMAAATNFAMYRVNGTCPDCRGFYNCN